MITHKLTPFLVAFVPTYALASDQASAEAKITASFSAAKQEAKIQLALPDGIKLNYDGPWKLEISGPIVDTGKLQGLHTKENFNKNSQEFLLAVPQKTTQEQVLASKWKLTYFLCNKANTWCKRLSAQGGFQL